MSFNIKLSRCRNTLFQCAAHVMPSCVLLRIEATQTTGFGVSSVRYPFALYSELQPCCMQPNGTDALQLVEFLTELEQRVFSSSIRFTAAPVLGIAIPITPKQEGGFSACRCKRRYGSAASFCAQLARPDLWQHFSSFVLKFPHL